MKTCAIIAEYNPFHNGHAYLVREAVKRTGADFCMAVMSGDFVQRGGPAILPARMRCLTALSEGLDMVFELPSYGACASAEFFAESAVSILNQLGCVDYLVFGCESEDLDLLKRAAALLADEPDAFKACLKEGLKSGLDFPSARSKALMACLPGDMPAEGLKDLLHQPNTILALEYLKALIRTDSPMIPVAVRRQGAAYHDTALSSDFSSAAAVRAFLQDHAPSELPAGKLPETTLDIFRGLEHAKGFPGQDDFSEMIAHLLIREDRQLGSYCDMTDELAARILNMAPFMTSFSDLVRRTGTRHYTDSRIRRCLFHLLLDHKKAVMEAWKSGGYKDYVRLLGMRRTAGPLLSAAGKNAPDMLMVRPARDIGRLSETGRILYETDQKAHRLYRQAALMRHGLSFDDMDSLILM